jgi:hypothetical protein
MFLAWVIKTQIQQTILVQMAILHLTNDKETEVQK